jgi:hypothetical protein
MGLFDRFVKREHAPKTVKKSTREKLTKDENRMVDLWKKTGKTREIDNTKKGR